MTKMSFIFLLFISTKSALDILISSNELTQPKKFIFKTLSEIEDITLNQEKIKLTFLTSSKIDKTINFESSDIEMM